MLSVLCPTDYVLFTDPTFMTSACYFISTTATDFDNAQAACVADGGGLAVPLSDAENQFLYGILLIAGSIIPLCFLGLTGGPMVSDDASQLVYIGVTCAANCIGMINNFLNTDGSAVSLLKLNIVRVSVDI